MTETPTMLERVAAAIRARMAADAFTDADLARAALTALLEPSAQMVEAGEDAIIYHPDDIIRNQAEPCWSAMITTALEGGSAR
jgi:hypothetical protein